ncbi:hypothetical protein BH11MYX4_BH11MYX4_43650 [soil metagenome]
MLRVAKISLVAIPLFALLTTAACGSKKPPTPPSMEPVDAAAGTDMPAPPSTVALTGDAGPTTDAGSPGIPDPAAAPAALSLPTATAKVALKGKKPGAVEIKSDGSVMSAGKLVGKFSGMAMQSAEGKDVLKVGSDGAVTTDGGTAYGSFTGDDLTLAKGDKVSVGDDGTVTMTTGGKAAPLGKFENLGAARKAAALAVAFISAPPAAEKPAAPAKPAAKPKPAPKK